MKWAIIELATATISQLIEYDGESDFNPGDGFKVMKVPMDKQVGDVVEVPSWFQ